jgi:hypothetical protein
MPRDLYASKTSWRSDRLWRVVAPGNAECGDEAAKERKKEYQRKKVNTF